MKVPITWLSDFVEIDLPLRELAQRLTMAGLEVEEIRYIGRPVPDESGVQPTAISGLGWDDEKIVVAEVREVTAHPNADRLVLCRLYDGEQEHTVLTGAPNLFPYKGAGELAEPLKVAYARQGAILYDGHESGWQKMELKPATIRGIESSSMICSEKELGISEDHEGVIILDPDAPLGQPLADYMGDAVFDIALTPNMARNANILGVAREVAALTGKPLRKPDLEVDWEGPSIDGRVTIEIQEPALNPRFVAGLVEDVKVGPSPYEIRRRLKLAGMRPINNIVDATNYAMLEIGEPLHAFDYDVLLERAAGEAPKIITRSAKSGEVLTTLDGVDRELEDFTVLVCDERGPLSIAGIMGGEESEVGEGTRNVLLEGAAWDFINIRRSLSYLNLPSEAAYRFSRGVHPALAGQGVRRGLQLMGRVAGGRIAQGLVDAYPLPPQPPQVTISGADAKRWLGFDLSAAEMADLLKPLEFDVQVKDDSLTATAPDHRLDIGEGIIGIADLMEEVARLYGYDRIPNRMLEEELAEQPRKVDLEKKEALRSALTGLGLQEVVTYRLTSENADARSLLEPAGGQADSYIRITNPSSRERDVLRRNLLSSVLEVVDSNARHSDKIALFEIGPVFLAPDREGLPEETEQLAIALSGYAEPASWADSDRPKFDFYDLKGLLESLFSRLQIEDVLFGEADHPSFHPGKTAKVVIQGQPAGVLGELHPMIRERYELMEWPVQGAVLDVGALLDSIPVGYNVKPVPEYPAVLEDVAVIVDENLPAAEVERVIRQAGGELLAEVQLFDLFRGKQLGPGVKSLAYSLIYQASDRTLTDPEVATVREKIVTALERQVGARLRAAE